MNFRDLLTLSACALALNSFAFEAAAKGPVSCADDPTQKKCGGTTEPPPPLANDGVVYDGPDLNFDGYVVPLTFRSWMHEDVGLAHFKRFTGLNTKIIVLDNYAGTKYSGDLQDGTTQSLAHGGWTNLQASLVAPDATTIEAYHPQFTPSGAIVAGTDYSIVTKYQGSGLNVVNLSFGLFDSAGLPLADYSLGTELWDSLVTQAKNGTGVFVKAAGNTSGGTVDGVTKMRLYSFKPENAQDYLNLQLIGAPGALFVGALDGNGSTSDPALIASYSTIAGPNTAIQDMFIVAGVENGMTGLSGTSFAAPIVSGYAAIIGQKFSASTPAQVVDQLLLTARTDTIADFAASCTQTNNATTPVCTRSSVYGRGEADLSRALAPTSLPY